MQAYLENLANGGGEPIKVSVKEETGGRLCIVMSSLRKQNRVDFALHIDKELLNVHRGIHTEQDTGASGTGGSGKEDA